MSKTVTISLENLNSLYIRFINQFVVQYLPKNVYNQISALLSIKSPVQAYRYLDRVLNEADSKKQGDKLSQIHGQKSSMSNKGEKSNISNQGSSSYLDKDQATKYQHDQIPPNPNRKSPLQLKRTNTYQVNDQKTSQKFFQSLKLDPFPSKKQQPSTSVHNNFIIQNTSPIEQSHQSMSKHTQSSLNQYTGSGNHVNVVKHDFDTVSERNANSGHGGMGSAKRESKEAENLYQNQKQSGNTYLFKVKKDSDVENTKDKQKSDETLSNPGYKRLQLNKTYSIQQSTTPKQFPTQPLPHAPNRLKLQSLIRQTKQIFTQNSKKIQRYQKISNDLNNKQQGKGGSENYLQSYKQAQNITQNNGSYVGFGYSKKY